MKLTSTIIFSLVAQMIWGQTELRKRKYVYLEIAGSGGLGSINYEKVFRRKSNIEYTWRAGFSLAPVDRNNGTGIVFPLMVNAIIGKRSHKLELGLGQGITVTTKGSFFILTTAAVGYRHQPATSKWFYRITYAPLISYLFNFQVQQWGGMSIGFTFNTKTK